MTENAQSSSPRPCPVRRKDLRVHELDGEALIFDPRSSDTHRLNETALLLWQHCDGQHNAAGMANTLAGRYNVTPQEALQHVERTIGELLALGLVLQTGGGEPGRLAV